MATLIEQLEALIDQGLEFPAVVTAFAARQDESLNAYRDAAPTREGELEVDDNAIVSVSEDGGAYVMAWVWVSDDDR
jgi:hypothetical protein